MEVVFACSVLVLVASVIIIATCPIRGVGRWLAPCSMAAIMIAMIFGIRPLFTDRFRSVDWYGYIPTTEGQVTSSLVGVAAIASILAGTLLSKNSRLGEPSRVAVPSRVGLANFHMSYNVCLVITAVTSLLYLGALALLAGPGIFNLLLGGRVNTDSPISGVPELVMIIPMTGAICAALLILTRDFESPIKLLLITLLCTGISFFLVSQLGNRRFIIPVILMPAIAVLIRRPTRIKIWHVIVGFVGIVFIAIVPMVRAAGARLPNENIFTAALRYFSEEGLRGVLEPIFSSYDTEMYDYIALLSGPLQSGSIEYGLGRGTILEMLIHPLPSFMSPATVFSDEIMSKFWGGGCGHPVCPVASVAGVLFFDGGFFFVVVGGFLFGYAIRKLSVTWLYVNELSPARAISVLVASSFILIATRTNTVYAAWWTLYAVGIALAVVGVVRYLTKVKAADELPILRATSSRRDSGRNPRIPEGSL